MSAALTLYNIWHLSIKCNFFQTRSRYLFSSKPGPKSAQIKVPPHWGFYHRTITQVGDVENTGGDHYYMDMIVTSSLGRGRERVKMVIILHLCLAIRTSRVGRGWVVHRRGLGCRIGRRGTLGQDNKDIKRSFKIYSFLSEKLRLAICATDIRVSKI